MEKKTFEVLFSDGQFWLQCECERGPYEETLDCQFLDNLANGLMWTVSTKETTRSRKWRASSAMTKSIAAQLDLVRDFLNYNHLVMVQTPDIEVIFYRG